MVHYKKAGMFFLNSGLVYYLGKSHASEVSILEVGFGTGLNFLLSAEFCSSNQIKLDYTGIEAYPLNPEMISQTGYDQYVSKNIGDDFFRIYPESLDHRADINPYCKLQTAHCKLLDFESDRNYDVIYFDAFASVHQPEMWDERSVGHTIGFLKPGGVFVTYAVTGNLKRMLKAFGLKVEKAPGAPGKREMLRAVRCADE